MEARRQCWVLVMCIVLSMCLITTSATVLENLLQSRTRNLFQKRSSASRRCTKCRDFTCTLLCMDKRDYNPTEEISLAVQKRTQEEQVCVLDEILEQLPEQGKEELFNVIMRWVDYD